MSFHDDDVVCNTSTNPTFAEIAKGALSRRVALKGSLGLAGATFLGCGAESSSGAPGELEGNLRPGPIGFRPIPISAADTVVVPEGYHAEVLYAWGDPISDGPAFAQDASNTAGRIRRSKRECITTACTTSRSKTGRMARGTASWFSITSTPMTACCTSAEWSRGRPPKSPSHRQRTAYL